MFSTRTTSGNADGSGNSERVLTLNYIPGTSFVESVTDGTRTWRYSYGVGASGWPHLATVTLPDGSSWQFGGMDGDSSRGIVVNIWLDYAETEPNGEECDAQPNPNTLSRINKACPRPRH
jgi:hypothetical protein